MEGGGSSSSSFIPSDVVTAVQNTIETAKDDIVRVITDNFTTILEIVGAMVGLALLFWVGRVVKRAMSSR